MGFEKDRVTIRDVAARAGVSSATISNIINNKRCMVGEKTRDNVLKIIDEMGYRPSSMAKNLKRNLNHVIGVQFDSIAAIRNSSRYVTALGLRILQGICSHAYSRGFQVQLLNADTGMDYEYFKDFVKSEDSMDGIIIQGWANLDEGQIQDILSQLDRFKIPFVTTDRRIMEKGRDAVSVNLESGISKACERMAELGHKSAAYIGSAGYASVQERISRFSIFNAELEKHGAKIHPEMVRNLRLELDSYRETARLMREAKNPPTCVIYSSDHLAMAGVEAMLDLGLDIPGDVSAVSVDDAPFAAESKVPLATVAHDFLEQGRTLARMLIDRLESPDAAFSGVMQINSKFIERASLGPARKRGEKK